MNNLPRVPRFCIAAALLALAAASASAQAPVAKNAAVAALEQRIVLPSVAYEKAAVTNVLADVEAKTNAAAPAGSPRLRIRLDEAVTNELPAVTLRASSIGVLPLLSMVADMTGLEHCIQDGQIVLGAPAAESAPAPWPAPSAAAPAAPSAEPGDAATAPAAIVHRQYPIRQHRAGRSTDPDGARLKEWFAGKGVAWPEGSSLTLPAPGILHVANTVENLDRIESILRGLPSQQTR